RPAPARAGAAAGGPAPGGPRGAGEPGASRGAPGVGSPPRAPRPGPDLAACRGQRRPPRARAAAAVVGQPDVPPAAHGDVAPGAVAGAGLRLLPGQLLRVCA